MWIYHSQEMDQELISPLTCGFGRIAAYWSTKEAKNLFSSNKKLAGIKGEVTSPPIILEWQVLP